MVSAFRIMINKKKAVTYCQQVLFIVKVFMKCSLQYCTACLFLLCHNLRLHMLKNSGTEKTALSISCARFNNQDSPPPP